MEFFPKNNIDAFTTFLLEGGEIHKCATIGLYGERGGGNMKQMICCSNYNQLDPKSRYLDIFEGAGFHQWWWNFPNVEVMGTD